MEGETVKLRIKSPSARLEDLLLELPRDGSTVIQLKQRIAAEFPARPCPSQQKLVYSGKFLKDGDRLVRFMIKAL